MNPTARSRAISSPIIETAEELFYRLQVGICVKVVLSEFPRDTWHIRGFPCKDVPILTEELDEHAFLFIKQLCPNDELLTRITRDKVNFLCILSRLELGVVVGSRFLQDC